MTERAPRTNPLRVGATYDMEGKYGSAAAVGAAIQAGWEDAAAFPERRSPEDLPTGLVLARRLNINAPRRNQIALLRIAYRTSFDVARRREEER